jgi:hypothetical protein
MSSFFSVLCIAYIVIGAYCAGITAHELRSGGEESILRILSWVFGWPYMVYKDLKDWRPDRD